MTWQELEEAWKPASKKLHNAIAHNGWDKARRGWGQTFFFGFAVLGFGYGGGFNHN